MGVLTAVSPDEFQWIKQFMREHSGVDLQAGKEYFVENRLAPLLAPHGCQNFSQFIQKLARDNGPLRTKVVDALTTHETLWFRDDSFFSALADEILPRLASKSRQQKIRIWSAAAATGQEAYSVAMLLDAAGRKQDPNFDISRMQILGTDISASSLVTARQGRYNHLAISRGMRPGFLETYFKREGDIYEVAPHVRRAVKFEQFNLKDDFAPLGKFDLILCRNVLIYFSDDLKRQICIRMRSALNRPEGYFAIGASESLMGLEAGFKQITVGRAVLYQPML
ncbi:MAG: protein-glutamate O-methyltransferase CheR [Magnetococcales bacterium]|nr:protein-glutamate O-methyltransferase CheR [Magnetococcales bacterium]